MAARACGRDRLAKIAAQAPIHPYLDLACFSKKKKRRIYSIAPIDRPNTIFGVEVFRYVMCTTKRCEKKIEKTETLQWAEDALASNSIRAPSTNSDERYALTLSHSFGVVAYGIGFKKLMIRCKWWSLRVALDKARISVKSTIISPIISGGGHINVAI